VGITLLTSDEYITLDSDKSGEKKKSEAQSQTGIVFNPKRVVFPAFPLAPAPSLLLFSVKTENHLTKNRRIPQWAMDLSITC